MKIGKVALIGSAFFLSCLAIIGYKVHVANHALQLPLVDFLTGTAVYPGDYFVQTLSYYGSILWRLVAMLTRVFSLEHILFAGFLLEKLLLIFAAGRLAYSFYPGSQLAIIGSMATFSFLINPILGGGTISTNNFEQTGFALPFFLLAMAMFIERRKTAWAILLAVGFNLNSMYGVYACSYFFAMFLFGREYFLEFKKWIISFLLFLLLSLPALIPSFGIVGKSDYDTGLWLAAGNFLLSCHLFPLMWPVSAYIKFLMLIVLAGFLRFSYGFLYRQGIIWTLTALAWLCLAFLGAYVINLPEIIQLQPARGADLWYCFVITALVSMFGAGLEKYGRNPWLALGFALSIVFLASLSDIQFIGFIIVITLCVGLLKWFDDRDRIADRTALLLVLLIVPIGWLSFMDQGMSIIDRPASTDIPAIAQWAKEQTPPDSVFLINPMWQEFRELSRRPVFATFKDGSALLWCKPVVGEWYDRLRTLGIDIRKEELKLQGGNEKEVTAAYTKRYLSLNDTNIKKMKNKYQLDYWVVPTDFKSDYPVEYADEHNKVLKI